MAPLDFEAAIDAKAARIKQIRSPVAGLDALVFTAGIGEHSPPVRAALCERLAWLGVVLDPAANASNGPQISSAESAFSVWVVPTDEELMIAQHTEAVLARA
jgi:acetate kinase